MFMHVELHPYVKAAIYLATITVAPGAVSSPNLFLVVIAIPVGVASIITYSQPFIFRVLHDNVVFVGDFLSQCLGLLGLRDLKLYLFLMFINVTVNN
jgi:hypothetical protein